MQNGKADCIRLNSEIERAHLLIANGARGEFGDFEDRLEEINNLCDSSHAEIVGITVQKQRKPIRTYLGLGKLKEARNKISEDKVHLIIVDDELSPNQQRFLEDFFQIKIVDRTALILDIFAARAKSKEGKLQVQLAQFQYLLPRLAGQWSHLERLGGGIGTRGPGETQIETDRRLVRKRITKIKKELAKMKTSRYAQRVRRLERAFNVSLVGYTNAGKSTLFNQLVRRKSLSSGKLFSTLDTKTGKMFFRHSSKACTLSDTVGFVNKLPTVLIDAFKATLEELNDANLLLHIIDSSNKNFMQQIEIVDVLLEELGLQDKTIIYVLNKSDKLIDFHKNDVCGQLKYFREINGESFVELSAKTGYNIDFLKNMIQKYLNKSYNDSSAISLARVT